MGFNLTQDPLHDFNESLQKSLLDTGALFVLEYSFHSAMVVFLGSAIDGTTYGDTGSTLSQLFINETALSAKTIEDTMENIAKAITIAIRSNGASVYSDPALGVVHTSAVHSLSFLNQLPALQLALTIPSKAMGTVAPRPSFYNAAVRPQAISPKRIANEC
ncbi:hypothetical protein N0V93_002176 [Gnomoniopsis smithogilvyi]|uniref:Uncharacterized protein n=1 Tax=Gnomoniopsis smithogilvyi TaxID=1191159 RepID=A0A9W8YUU1_9PEZI|nr:hypothetical protein N0V93_002176 [Gnomoniopsis smithogilvyi]